MLSRVTRAASGSGPAEREGTIRTRASAPFRPEGHDRARQVLAKYFPALAEMPVNETRACHYCSVVSRNFLVDKHPRSGEHLVGGRRLRGVLQAGTGARRVHRRGVFLGTETDEELNASFRLVDELFPPRTGPRRTAGVAEAPPADGGQRPVLPGAGARTPLAGAGGASASSSWRSSRWPPRPRTSRPSWTRAQTRIADVGSPRHG